MITIVYTIVVDSSNRFRLINTAKIMWFVHMYIAVHSIESVPWITFHGFYTVNSIVFYQSLLHVGYILIVEFPRTLITI